MYSKNQNNFFSNAVDKFQLRCFCKQKPDIQFVQGTNLLQRCMLGLLKKKLILITFFKTLGYNKNFDILCIIV